MSFFIFYLANFNEKYFPPISKFLNFATTKKSFPRFFILFVFRDESQSMAADKVNKTSSACAAIKNSISDFIMQSESVIPERNISALVKDFYGI
jgi:penicillin-binding protein-related factor A (putative recombinase)